MCSGIPLNEFFPFGDNAGDIVFPPNDDESTSFEVNFGFTFYNKTYQTVFVSVYVWVIWVYIFVCVYLYCYPFPDEGCKYATF